METTAILYALLGLSTLSLLLNAILLLRGARQSAGLSRPLQDELRAARAEQAAQARALREEVTSAGKAAADIQLQLTRELRESQLAQFEAFSARVAASLEEIRATVDEKLHQALERRLGESFALVSDRLEAVQRGLGEMQSLASGVGDLKRVLAGVRTRGVWGEYQLEAILERILTPDQYRANYRPNEEGALEAADRADAEGFREATAALVRTVRGCAREMSEKYVHPPATTDFAVWRVLGAVKAEFARFGSVLDKLKRQLNTASNTVDELGKRTRAMERPLREVEELPPDLAREVVGLVGEPAALLDNVD